jgi:hypothetical protein
MAVYALFEKWQIETYNYLIRTGFGGAEAA